MTKNLATWFADSARPVLIIGEVAQAHDGSLGAAHAHIDAIAAAGADAVKFQTHIAEAESTPAEPWRVRFSEQDATRYDYWKRMEFAPAQWRALKEHAEQRGLLFLSSPFSFAATDLLEDLGIEAWKVASGEIGNLPLIERIAATAKPVLLSTGMSPTIEIDEAVGVLRDAEVPFAVLQCTSRYPSAAEDVGLNQLALFRERYDSVVGLSDHSGTIYPGLAAATLGADLIEVHVTLSREAFGPDVIASVTSGELQQLVEGTRFIERMRSSPISKNEMAEELSEVRSLFTKSLVASRDLPAGAVLQESDVTAKKPGTGIGPNRVEEIVGRRLTRSLSVDEILDLDDLE